MLDYIDFYLGRMSDLDKYCLIWPHRWEKGAEIIWRPVNNQMLSCACLNSFNTHYPQSHVIFVPVSFLPKVTDILIQTLFEVLHQFHKQAKKDLHSGLAHPYSLKWSYSYGPRSGTSDLAPTFWTHPIQKGSTRCDIAIDCVPSKEAHHPKHALIYLIRGSAPENKKHVRIRVRYIECALN